MKKVERIQVNGEWYVKESSIEATSPIEGEIKGIVHNRLAVYEDEDIVLECVYSMLDEPSEYDTPYIKFLDKKEYGLDYNNEEFWDNTMWMWGVYENNQESITQIPYKYLQRVRLFIKYMIDNGILKKS